MDSMFEMNILYNLSIKMKSPIKDFDVNGIWLLYKYESVSGSKRITVSEHPLKGFV